MTTTLPIVDLSLSDRHAATIVRDACTRYGFMFVTNHGIGAAAIRDTFAQIRAFFALPVDEKLRMRLDANNRGYSPLFEQDLDPANQRYHGDTCEGLYFGREVVDGDPESALPLHGPNQWPDEARLPQFRRVVEAYFEACRVLGMRVIRLLALALDLPANHFDADFEKPTILLRPLHYPPTPSAPEEGIRRVIERLYI